MTKTAAPRTWTKDDEISWLDNSIAILGPRSYLGPWLAENRDRIAQDIRNDFTPTALLPDESYKLGTKQMEETRAECAAMLSAARDKAEQVINAANDQARRTREQLRADIRAFAFQMANSL